MTSISASSKMAADLLPYVGAMLKQKYPKAALRRDGQYKNVVYMALPNGETFELVVWNISPRCTGRTWNE